MSVLVAPTEPALLKAAGTMSGVPERAGVDVMWTAFGGLVGVQRKDVKDLLASIDNGRLNTELAKARSRLKATWLLVEGKLHWSRDGKLAGELGRWYPRWTEDAYWAFLSGVQASGVWVGFTEDLAQTVQWVERHVKWSQKAKHTSLMTRPNPRGKWGTATNREWCVHLLCSFEGISVGRAEAILDTLGLPIGWLVGEKELRSVPGIGPKLAQKLTLALSPATFPKPEASNKASTEGVSS